MAKRKKNPHAVALGRKGGKVLSAAKTLASRANGAKGGRPPRKPAEEDGHAFWETTEALLQIIREDAVVRAAIRDGLAKGIHAPVLAALLAHVEAES